MFSTQKQSAQAKYYYCSWFRDCQKVLVTLICQCQQICFNISAALYRQWLNQKAFTDELIFRSESAKRASRILLSQYLTVAAAKLVALTGSEKEETARRACLDILSLNDNKTAADDEMPADEPVLNISPETASKLLKVLAEAD